jgi:predicted aldo/keto reductase-like oxidoreductase
LLYRKLGKTGQKVSILGFGCMRLPVTDGNPEHIDKKQANEMLHYSLDHGVNLFDTAYSYHGPSATQSGQSEIWLGDALKDGCREDVYISTKLPSWLIEKKEDLNYYLDKQLEKLQTDYIDFYHLHGLGQGTWPNLERHDALEFLDSALEEGKIRYAGFSFHDKLELFKEIVDSYNWDFSLIQYNYMDQDFQAGKEGLHYLTERNMGVMTMEPLRGGCLTNNVPQDILAIWDKAETKRSLAEWALRFLWDQEEINVVLSGASTLEQVKENVKIAEEGYANSLTSDEKNLIEEVREAYSERVHAMCTICGYCMPCPVGVAIPLNLSLLNDLYVYQNMEKPLGNYTFLTAKKESATFCTECGECEEKCTQKLPIQKLLKEASDIFDKEMKKRSRKK